MPGSAANGEVLSNTLSIKVADASTIARKWGPQVKNLAVDVTLDKNTYAVGEDVALHIAMENFGADRHIYGPSLIWHPCQIVTIQLFDSTSGENRKAAFECRDSGPSSSYFFEYVTGKVIPLEFTLREVGLLPDKPGTYSVVVTWAPFGSKVVCLGAIPIEPVCQFHAPYATVHSASGSFRILEPAFKNSH
ncbi:MAG TPA: hypothetical protein VG272_00920 [Candidatus Acidoferrales bacterium]|jgi:hypothetical protein|nr:hypothetical protein [Candidatus Acidoferrales bacterium]